MPQHTLQQSPQYVSEEAFETAVIDNLTQLHGWSKKVIDYPSEHDLIDNWARIIFENNSQIDRLNGVPLSEAEKQFLVEEIATRTKPVELHKFLQAGEVEMVRDNALDQRNHGKHIWLKIFDPTQVAGGDSTYQIARQPQFKKKNVVDKNRRGDFILLIWGLPLIHVELKNSRHTCSEAVIQIQRYMDQDVFSGFFNAIQVFVALTPDDMRYFARPNDADSFTHDFQFKWSDSNNEWYTDWRNIVATFLGIPHAHELVGNYMIPDSGDGVLKVLRPYQIYAVRAILHKLRSINRLDREDWSRNTQKGGFVWHTTGSGKTMTSFKAATLLARQHLADKVVFVLDRIELSDQSMKEYENFSDSSVEIFKPRSAWQLLGDLKNTHKRLILTSLHKLGDLCSEESTVGEADFDKIQKQRVVFVLDEAHRSTFGQMFADIKKRFPHAIFIGFTGTPIHEENKRKNVITSTLFGDELHRYSIYHGLRDGNVLEFETLAVDTVPDLRKRVALREAHAATVDEAMADDDKRAIFDEFNDPTQVPWATYVDSNGKTVKGIEEIAGKENWSTLRHRKLVVDYINQHWAQRSRGGKLHAMLAANSVMDAISYYRLFKNETDLRVTAVFTDSGEHTTTAVERDRGIREILTDYNARYNQHFSRENIADFKTDASSRLAHKDRHRYITDDEKLDLIIVVDQLLTGYDSKWVNTLYLDRVLPFDRLVQAFSRTNRVLNAYDKPFGSIVFFRMIHTMQNNIKDAFDLYAGNQAHDVFVDTLPETLGSINRGFAEIIAVFAASPVTAGTGPVGAAPAVSVPAFHELPQGIEARRKFAITFAAVVRSVQSALIQGFTWDKLTYDFPELPGQPDVTVTLDKPTYDILLSRYAELGSDGDDSTSRSSIPLNLGTLAAARDAQRIDFDYMDAKFDSFRKALKSAQVGLKEREILRSQVQSAYATLSQEDQGIARIILDDIEAGRIDLNEDKTFRDYINDHKVHKQNTNVESLHHITGISQTQITQVLAHMDGTVETLAAFNRLKNLLDAVDYAVFAHWLKESKHRDLDEFLQSWAAEKLLRWFFLNDGTDPDTWDDSEIE